MKYPDDFDTPTFSAGRHLASSRWVATSIMIVFLSIIFACGILLWAQNSVRVHPFLVSINNITGQWNLVGHHHDNYISRAATYTLQESVVGRFVKYWFLISDNDTINETLWRSCDRQTECSPKVNSDLISDTCAIYCLAADELYSSFTTNVVPQYQQNVVMNDVWVIRPNSLQITPIGETGIWQVRVDVLSSLNPEPIKIIAYANVARNTELYPRTLGYYVADFNAYRIGQ